MPFKSESQRKWMHSNDPDMARRWEKHTSKSRDLPERVAKMTQLGYMRAFKSTKAGSAERGMLMDARRIGFMTVVEENGDTPLLGKKMADGGFSKEETVEVAGMLDVDLEKEKFDVSDFRRGLNTELEHSKVTKKDAKPTGQIALDHLREVPTYYKRLKRYVEKDIHKAMKSGPMKMIGKCAKCSATMIGKHCGCNSKHGKGKVPTKMPMIGKADELFDELPPEVKAVISRLPLEMQATDLGGAGATDIRPTQREMNYEMPARHPGTCATCDHSKTLDIPGYPLVCGVLQSDPAVAREGRCDLWTGSAHKSMTGKARNGAGPTIPYGEQSMPDYEMIYHITPKKESAKREQRASDDRRRAAAWRNSGRFGFHGEPPSPVIESTPDKYPSFEPKKVEKFQTKPVVQAPVIQTKRTVETDHDRLQLVVPRSRPAKEEADKPKKRGKAMHGKMRLVIAGDHPSRPAHTDEQGTYCDGELMWFPDEMSAKTYCDRYPGKDAICVDTKVAKKYGVLEGGYLVLNVDTGIFEAMT